jgi:hypothetical protein
MRNSREKRRSGGLGATSAGPNHQPTRSKMKYASVVRVIHTNDPAITVTRRPLAGAKGSKVDSDSPRSTSMDRSARFLVLSTLRSTSVWTLDEVRALVPLANAQFVLDEWSLPQGSGLRL